MMIPVKDSFVPRFFHLETNSQNCHEVGYSHYSHRYMSIGIVAIPVQIGNRIVDVRKHVPMIETNDSEWPKNDLAYLKAPFSFTYMVGPISRRHFFHLHHCLNNDSWRLIEAHVGSCWRLMET